MQFVKRNTCSLLEFLKIIIMLVLTHVACIVRLGRNSTCEFNGRVLFLSSNWGLHPLEFPGWKHSEAAVFYVEFKSLLRCFTRFTQHSGQPELSESFFISSSPTLSLTVIALDVDFKIVSFQFFSCISLYQLIIFVWRFMLTARDTITLVFFDDF